MTNPSFTVSESLREYDSIRNYLDEEVSPALAQLVNEPEIIETLLSYLAEDLEIDHVIASLKKIDSVGDFQAWMRSMLTPLVNSTINEFSASGLEHLDPSKPHIFISNHHDIIFDPLLVNFALIDGGFDTAYCAIGDNLLQSTMALSLAKLNKCFQVKRSLSSPKAMLKAMKLQSAYIKHLSSNHQAQIWIAQKEGRAKDRVDETNPALIKMLCLAKPPQLNVDEYLHSLNIVPVSISYEWDPCDTQKAQQMEEESANTNYEKSALDDIAAIRVGMLGNKGNAHVAFGQPVRAREEHALNRYEVAEQIDHFIHKNYRLFPVNYAAARVINAGQGGLDPKQAFAEQEIAEAQAHLEERLGKENEQIRERVLKAYAQPYLANQP